MASYFSFEEIEEYLSGTLPADRTAIIEAEMERDAGLAATIEKHRAARLLLRQYAVQKLKGKVKGLHGELSETDLPSKTHWLKIAATLLILVVAGGYLMIGSIYDSDKLVGRAFSPYPDRFTTMGVTDDNIFSQALEYYTAGQYDEAIQLFSSIPVSHAHFTTAKLYAGVSYLALDQPEQAISTLQPLAVGDEAYSDAARWYLALAYVKSNRQPEAEKLLEEIVSTKGYQSKTAEELLGKLRSVWRQLPGI